MADHNDDKTAYSEFNFTEFYAQHFNDGRYIYSSKTNTWYYYDSLNILRESCTRTPFRLKNEICKNMDTYIRQHPDYAAEIKLIKMVGSSGFAEDLMGFLRGFYACDDLEDKVDAQQNLIAFNDGFLYDINTNICRKIEKEDFISKTMSIPHTDEVSNEKVAEIQQIIYSLFEDDTMTDYFIKTLALSLFTTKFEKLHILTGNGRNGKSLIMNYLSSILKGYATTAESDFLTSKMRNGISCTLVNSRNTRMLLLSEPNNDEEGREMKMNNALIKSITGNDEITARALYKNSITFKPTFNVFLLCNEIPSLEKVEYSMIERLNIIKFGLTFVNEKHLKDSPNNRLIDVELKKRLSDDEGLKQAFIHLLFNTAHEHINKPFVVPESLAHAKEEYLDEVDIVKHFLSEFIQMTGNDKDRIKPTNLHNFFKNVMKSTMGVESLLSRLSDTV